MTNSNPLPNTPDLVDEVVKASAGGLEFVKIIISLTEGKKIIEKNSIYPDPPIYYFNKNNDFCFINDYGKEIKSSILLTDFIQTHWEIYKDDQCFCTSHFDDDNNLVDCTCGKCKIITTHNEKTRD